MKRLGTSIVCAVGFVATATLLEAQGRGGRAGGPGAAPAATKGVVEQIVVHGKALEGNLEGDSPDREATVYLPPSYAGSPARRYPGPLPAPRLRRAPGHVHRAPREPRREPGSAGAAAGLQRVHRRDAERLHAAQGQHVFELADDRRLGALRRRGPRRLHGQPLPHARHAHEPRARRPLDGRLRRAAHRHEAAGRVLGAVSHELVLPDARTAIPRPEAIAAVGGDHDPGAGGEAAASAPGFGPSTSLASAAAWSPNPSNPPLYLDLPVKDGKVRPDDRRQVGGQRADRDGRAARRRAEPLLRDRHRRRPAGRAAGVEPAAARGAHAACTCRTASRSTRATTPTRCASASSATCCRSSRRTSRRRSTRRRRRRSRRAWPALSPGPRGRARTEGRPSRLRLYRRAEALDRLDAAESASACRRGRRSRGR